MFDFRSGLSHFWAMPICCRFAFFLLSLGLMDVAFAAYPDDSYPNGAILSITSVGKTIVASKMVTERFSDHEAYPIHYFVIDSRAWSVEKINQARFERDFAQKDILPFKAHPKDFYEMPRLIYDQNGTKYEVSYGKCEEQEEGGPYCDKFSLTVAHKSHLIALPKGSTVTVANRWNGQIWVGAKAIGEINYYPKGLHVFDEASNRLLYTTWNEESETGDLPTAMYLDQGHQIMWVGVNGVLRGYSRDFKVKYICDLSLEVKSSDHCNRE